MSPAQTEFIIKEKMQQAAGKPRGLAGRKGGAQDLIAMFGRPDRAKNFAIERKQTPQ